jgi:hypothetical protein
MWRKQRHGWPRFFEALSVLLLIGGLVAGIGIIGWQAITWLESAVWVPVSVLAALKWLGIPWALAPTDWLALHKALDFIPLSITLVITGIVVAYMLWAYADHLRKVPKGIL